jgi:hypothetical protein
MADSFGLIDNAGAILNSSGDFTAHKNGSGYYTLRFNRNVHRAVIVASARNLQFCDNAGVGITVCNENNQPRQVGFMFDDPSNILGFSFILLDGAPGQEGD